ncbi:hypothetical protein G6F68_010914 [Rhizopus microsporus]|nr:hypothetical protein G6F68_010914 [Rhizopus microsporus]
MFFDLTNIDKTSNGKDTAASGTGLDVKRFYLTVDHKFNDIWSANLTTDFQYSSAIGNTELFVKKAYVQGSFDPAFNLRVGAADMPWIPYVEKFYGMRYVENTLTDRLKYGNSSDWGLHGFGNRNLERLAGAYGRVLDHHVDRTWIYLLVMVAALAASWGLLKLLPSELAPAEDRGSFQIMIDGPEGAGYDYTVQQVQQVEAMLAPHVGADKPIVRANPRVPGGWGASEEMHTGRVSIFLQPWRQRSEGTPEVANELQKELDTIRGVRVRTQVGGGLVRSGGQPGAIASCCAWPTIPAWSARTRTTRKPGRRCG